MARSKTHRSTRSTRELGSTHYDLDASCSITVFVEEKPGDAEGWYFILPNMTVNDGEQAIVVKLFDGCAISWDGRVIYHCTGLSELGSDGNCVYGNFFGGKKY